LTRSEPRAQSTEWELADERLDEALRQTFPASDPLSIIQNVRGGWLHKVRRSNIYPANCASLPIQEISNNAARFHYSDREEDVPLPNPARGDALARRLARQASLRTPGTDEYTS
jgi:hypothetical protein